MEDFLTTGDLRHVTKVQQLFWMQAVVWVPFDFMLLLLWSHGYMLVSDSCSHRSSKRYCLTNRSRYSRYVDVVSGWPGTPLFTRVPIVIDMSPKESTA